MKGVLIFMGVGWGMSWKDIFELFKSKVSNNQKTNWLTSYGKFDNFGESVEKHLMAEYVINALLVQKIEKEKGFTSVLEFLQCGKYSKENENYFSTLEKLTGITKATYNNKIWDLIRNEK